MNSFDRPHEMVPAHKPVGSEKQVVKELHENIGLRLGVELTVRDYDYLINKTEEYFYKSGIDVPLEALLSSAVDSKRRQATISFIYELAISAILDKKIVVDNHEAFSGKQDHTDTEEINRLIDIIKSDE